MGLRNKHSVQREGTYANILPFYMKSFKTSNTKGVRLTTDIRLDIDLTHDAFVYRYTGEYSLNIPADAGFGNNFNLVTFPDHAPQTQQVEKSIFSHF